MHIYCKTWQKLLLCLPILIIFGVFMIYPIFDTIYTSFFDRYMLSVKGFVGIDNYIKAFHDPVFWTGFKNTLIITVGSFLTQVPIAFLLGKFLAKPYKNGAFKTISFIPYILSGIMTGLIWSFLLDPSIGLFNRILGLMGNQEPILWIGGEKLTPYSVCLVLLWQAVGYHAVLFMAGFKMMSKDVIEAADVDGANALQKNWYVVLPSIKETIKMSATLCLVGGINQYQQTFMLTGGGPSHFSETLGTYTYYTEFTSFQFGYGSALATIILFLALISAIFMLQASSKKDDIS